MAAPIRFLSGRNQQQKIGIEGSTENQKVLEVVGRVGIGTTIFEPTSELEVRGDVIISGILTASNIEVSTGQVNFSQLNVTGVSTFGNTIDANGRIVGAATSNVIPFLYSNLTDLPSAATYHGAFAHVHSTGKAYYAHAGNWVELVNKEVNGTVGTGTERYNIGPVDLTTLDVSGISTFAGAADFNGSIDVDGHTELDDVNVSGVTTTSGLLDINAGGQANTFKVEDLTDNRVVIAGTGGELEDDANLTFNGTQLSVGVNLDVDGHTELDDLNVSGVSTFTGTADFNGSIDVDGHTELDNVNVSGAITATTFTGNLAGTINTAAQPNITSLGTLSALTVSGDITANGNIAGDNSTNITGIAGVTATTLSGTLQTAAQTNITSVGTLSALTVSGDITANGNIAGDNSTNITGIAGVTATTLSGTLQTAAQTNVTSVGTLSALTVSGDITANGNIAGDNSTNITGIAGVTATTLSGTLQTAAQTNVTSVGTLTGLDVNGHSELDDVNVSGIITTASLNATGKLTTTGIGISIANGAGNTAYIEGPSEIWIDPHPFGVGQTSGSVRIRGDLYVDGTEFIVDVDKIELGDFNIGIASTVSTNSLLDGAGLGIGATSIRKFITWNNATSALMSSENWNLASGKHYEINGTDVLTSDTLGSGVVNSSLTSVGTLGALTVSGNVNANGNIVGDNSTNITGIAGVTATTLSGTLQTAAQTNVTSLGTLSALTVSGDITANGNIAGDNATNITGIAGVTATTLSGTLQTAAQTNVTSLGTLSALTVSGDITANGNIAGDNATNITGIAGVTATTLSGTLQTAAQTNVTSLGTLSALTVSGDITANGNIAGDNATNISGINSVTATSLHGNGSNITDILVNNVIGAVEGISIRDEGSLVGTANSVGNINFVSSNLTATASGVGATITFTNTPTFDTVTVTNNITANGNIVGDNSTNITGINQVTATTFSGALSGNATSATTATTATNVTVADESSDTTCFPLFVTAATGGLAPKSGSNLTFNSADGTLTATDFNTTSDENLKDNIRTIEDPLAKVVEIRGVNFDWKETQKPSVGVIAQDVEKVFPELVANGEKKTVNYNGLIGLLIEVVKEQQTQINSLNERLSQLE